jgi:hypothetical protein
MPYLPDHENKGDSNADGVGAHSSLSGCTSPRARASHPFICSARCMLNARELTTSVRGTRLRCVSTILATGLNVLIKAERDFTS